MKKIFFRIIFAYLVIFNFSSQALALTQNIELWRKGIVSISNNIIRSPYEKVGEYGGTGFLISKREGIILTNKHIINNVNLNDTTVTFYNGREAKAVLVYSDPIQDFTFLKVDATKIPVDAEELKLSGIFPTLGEQVTIIGNNEGQGFSVQTGLITSINEISSFFSNQTIRISLNTRGGSSGSPIINSKGEVIALNYAVDNTYAYALPSAYLIDAFNEIKNNKTPVRNDIGALFGYYSLDKAVKYLNFPEALIINYLKDFPTSFNKCIIVESTITGTPAEKYLKPADIIWAINGKQIGANIYGLQKLFSQNNNQAIKLQLFRNGKLIELAIPVYNLHQNEIKRMVIFEGAVFFEADNLINLMTGVDLKSLFITNIDHNSSFRNIQTMNWNGETAYALKINRLGEYDVSNLDELISIIPKLVKKEHFTVHYINYMGRGGYDGNMFNAHTEEFEDIKFTGANGNPLLMSYDETSKSWIKQDIIK